MKNALLRTLPGRAIVIGLTIKGLVYVVRVWTGEVSTVLGAADTGAGAAIAAGGVHFLFKLLVLAKRRLLWRVRRRLILSYVFIGFVPAILSVSFFLLCGLLLFFNFSSYLVRTELRALQERARLLAASTAIEIQRGGGRDVADLVARRQTQADPTLPGPSLAVVPPGRACGDRPAIGAADVPPITAGPWAHMSSPSTLPSWIGCAGFSGLLAYSHRPGAADEDTHLLTRAVAFPDSSHPGYAVVVDVPITDTIKARIRSATGVAIDNAIAVGGGVRPLGGRGGGHETAAPDTAARSPFNSFTLVEYADWETGRRGTLVVEMQLSIAETYSRISAAQGFIGNRSYGQVLLIVLVVIGSLFLLTVFVALIAGLALAKSITGSVHELFAGTERIRRGDFTHRIAVTTNDQLGELAASFNGMTASIEGLLLEAAEKKRLEEELRIAHEIQMSLLPQGPLLMPGVSVTALCIPAREVGGDYYDFFHLDDHRLGVLIADVSGKGTSAALYMAELKGLVLSLSRIQTSPRELLVTANRLISEHLDARSFITMTYAVLDLQTRTMTYARAGHTPLIYVPGPGADSRRARILAPGGLVVGLKIDNGEMFERLLIEETIPLHAGDTYLFFTDGVSDAMNASDDCFGETRLAELVETHSSLRSDELRERVRREVEGFVGGAPQHDDMTMIFVKVDVAEVAETAAIATIDVETAAVGARPGRG